MCCGSWGHKESDTTEQLNNNNLPEGFISPGDASGKEPSCSISGSGRFPGGGHGNPLQYFCLENPMDRGA